MPRHGPTDENQGKNSADPFEEDYGSGSSFHFIREAQRIGSKEAWDFIYERYYTRALLYAEIQLGPQLRKQYSAEDLIQEVWLRVVKAIDKFDYRGKDSFFAWVCLNIRRVAATWGRKGSPHVIEANGNDSEMGIALDHRGTDEPGPRTLVGGKDLVAMLRESLECIPKLYREVLIDVLIEGRDRAEVAADRQLKGETLRKQINRGLEKWRESLGGLDPTEYLR